MSTKISLEGMEFFAFHGVYEEERKIGNKYCIDIAVSTERHELADKIKTTVNYEVLYKLAKNVMNTSHQLLETIAEILLEDIFQTFSDVEQATVKISKYNPPVGGICYKASIEKTKTRR